jgi:ABC-type oligopeptide transport system substrate-binding subunit
VSKKVLFLLAILVLVLGAAPLALAQQQGTGINQSVRDAQVTGPSNSSPQYADPQYTDPRTQPTGGGTQSRPSPTAGLTSLDQNNQLVIDCPGVSSALAQSGLTQAEQTQLQDLERLCTDSGFTPASSGGGTQPSSSDTGSTQPSQSQEASQ